MLNYEELTITKNGVSEYFWPVSILSQIESRDKIYSDLVGFIKHKNIESDRYAELFWINLTPIVTELMEIYSALEFKKEFLSGNRKSYFSVCESRLFLPVIHGESPGTPRHLDLLRKGLPYTGKLEPIKNILRLLKKPKPFSRTIKSRYRNEVMTISVSPLIHRHANKVTEKVYLSNFLEWMPAGSANIQYIENTEISKFINDLLSCINTIFFSLDCSLGTNIISYLKNIIKERIVYTEFYLNEVCSKKNHFPKEFWLGTAGNYWNKVMARAVSSNGGVCIGHDHGTGSGWWDSPVQTFIEFDHVDKFYTFTESQRIGLLNTRKKKYLVNEERCEILSADVEKNVRVKSKRNNYKKKIKTIMYVSTIYTGESSYLIPLHSDIVAIDWQARLFGFLAEKGYEILFKAHPESKVAPPTALINSNNVRLADNDFNVALNDADILLYDYPQSSTLLAALETEIPIIIFDFPRLNISHEAYEKITKRVVMQKSWYDENNRAQTNWTLLDESINNAGKINFEFIQSYF